MTNDAASAADRERDYSPSSCIGGNYRPFVAAYAQRSAQAYRDVEARGGRWIDVACGAGALPRVALALPGGDTPARGWPLLVFVHGGYWQELSAHDSLFAACDAVTAGFAFAALDYTLAPSARVGDIVDECCLAHTQLSAQAASLCVDPRRIVLAGHSAGAHLAAMTALAARDDPQPGRRIAGLVLISGVFDLEPLVGTSINDALQLDAADARRASPARMPLHGLPPSIVCWGEHETHAFKGQSGVFASSLAGAGVPCRSFEVPGRNHFDVVLDLAVPGTLLGDATRSALAHDPADA